MIQVYDETTPNWFRTICPVETPFERKERIEQEFKKLELARRQADEAYRDVCEQHDDRYLYLSDQLFRVNAELEAMGEDV